MSARFGRILVLAVALLLGRSAGATTSNCAGSADGTACASGCIALGHCMAGACVPTMLRPDGTASARRARAPSTTTAFRGCARRAPRSSARMFRPAAWATAAPPSAARSPMSAYPTVAPQQGTRA